MRIFGFLILIFIGINAGAQSRWHATSAADSSILNTFKFSHLSCDSAQVSREAGYWLNELISQGYYESAYEILEGDSCYHSNWRIGKRYSGIKLKYKHLPDPIVKFIKGLENRDGYINSDEFRRLVKSSLSYSENSGYPFATLRLDSIEIANDISAYLIYDSGSEITFGDVIIEGDVNLRDTWLDGYLNIVNGMTYDHSMVMDIQKKMDQLAFVSLSKPPEIIFHNNTADILLHLKSKPSNSIDGVVGFLPNESEPGKLLVTGQIDLSLSNLFRSAKSLNIEWQSLKPRSQFLEINYNHPRLLNTPMQFDFQFGLIKEDTLFINRTTELGLAIDTKHVTLSGLYKTRRSSTFIIREDSLVSDLAVDSYGLRLKRNYQYEPLGLRNGIEAIVEGFVGNRVVESIDGLTSQSVLYELRGSIQYKIRTFKNLVFHQRVSGAQLFGADLYLNDLYRVGGLKSLRGFNENFFFSDRYGIVSNEIQLYYQSESYFFAFYDQSYLSFNTVDSNTSDSPFGVGIGMAFKLNRGLLNLVYALGKSDNQRLDTRLSKIHFGYVATF